LGTRGHRKEKRRSRRAERHRRRAGQALRRPSVTWSVSANFRGDMAQAPPFAQVGRSPVPEPIGSMVADAPASKNARRRKASAAYLLKVSAQVIGGIMVLAIWQGGRPRNGGTQDAIRQLSADAVINHLYDVPSADRRRAFDAHYRKRELVDVCGWADDYPGQRGPHWCVALREAFAGATIQVITDSDLSNVRKGDCLIVSGTLFDFREHGDEIELEIGGAVKDGSTASWCKLPLRAVPQTPASLAPESPAPQAGARIELQPQGSALTQLRACGRG